MTGKEGFRLSRLSPVFNPLSKAESFATDQQLQSVCLRLNLAKQVDEKVRDHNLERQPAANRDSRSALGRDLA
jgi:hypothetical protein